MTARIASWLALSLVLALGASCGGGGVASPTTPGGGGGGGGGGPVPDLGVNADLNGMTLFPADNEWNRAVDGDPIDPDSDALIRSIGAAKGLHPDFGADWNGGPFGIPYVVVDASTPPVTMTFGYDTQSDPGPYPIPAGPPIEGGDLSTGDRHVLVLDRDAKRLYETWDTWPPAQAGLPWYAGSGALFDLTTNVLRPAGWTSADAAGLPILPGLVRYDEVVGRGAVLHALRFTVTTTRHAYVAPATHYASSQTSVTLPPMGMRVRLRAAYDITNFPPSARVVLQALKTYGMFVADNGGDWFISGAPDARWSDGELNTLKSVTGDEFEVVKMGPLTTN